MSDGRDVMAATDCPHCGPLHDRVCRDMNGEIDKTPWTSAERDEWREGAKRRDPSIVFAPSSAQMQDRFGERNRREKDQRRRA